VRFCPFCTAENVAEATTCAACGRRLPPPPTRKRGAGPPTSVSPVVPASSGAVTTPIASSVESDERRALRTSLLPPPAAARRKGATGEMRPAGADARRAGDLPLSPDATKTTISAPPAPDVTRTTISAPPSDFAKQEGTRPIDASWLTEISEGELQVGDDTSAKTLVAPEPGTALGRRKPTTMPPPVPAAAPAPMVPNPPKLPPPQATPSSVRAHGRDATALNPPPTRIVRDEAMADRPFTPPQVIPVPPIPEPGLVNVARYAITFGRARWQRRRAVKLLQQEIKSDTDALDGVLLTLGRDARTAGVDNRVLAAENQAITDAEKRRDLALQHGHEIGNRKLEEAAKYEEIERERTIKVTEAERALEEAQRELQTHEGQRRGLRDKRKELERRQKAYLSAAEARDTEAGNAPMGDTRGELRRMAEGHRREAASLDPERQDIERRLASLERPISYAQSKVETARAEVDTQRRSQADAREGHRHRIAELDAEASRQSREHDLINGEINRRLVNLGTLINLHRIERPEFNELYGRIDRLRNAINARTTEIDRLTAERDAYDRGSLLRGYAVLAGVGVLVITFIVIILALV
jgi:hypothetical protein